MKYEFVKVILQKIIDYAGYVRKNWVHVLQIALAV